MALRTSKIFKYLTASSSNQGISFHVDGEIVALSERSGQKTAMRVAKL
ncbi:MAG: hypothetical protein ACLRSW_12165 [Christensenellaceae bacterium]